MSAADEALARFAALLERERDALVAGDMPRVEAIALEKGAALAALPARADGRGADRALLLRMRSLNEENGRLIAWRSQRLGERLVALGIGAPEGTTYNAAGYARSRAY